MGVFVSRPSLREGSVHKRGFCGAKDESQLNRMKTHSLNRLCSAVAKRPETIQEAAGRAFVGIITTGMMSEATLTLREKERGEAAAND
jgi:chemotaxis response regulator CheB